MLVARYAHKKLLKLAIGQPLRYRETSVFGEEYEPNGLLFVVGPSATQRNWYASVEMKDGKIARVQ